MSNPRSTSVNLSTSAKLLQNLKLEDSDDSTSNNNSNNDNNSTQPQFPQIHINELTFGKKVGSGTYGMVYRGKYNGREVAIKTLFLKGEHLFEQEKEIMEKLTTLHLCHIVNFIGSGTAASNDVGFKSFIVMDYMPNGSLGYHIDNCDPFSLSLCQQVIGQIIEALFFLHKNDFVHRDLKDDNILFDGNMNAKLADFCFTQKANDTVDPHGHPRWMAPEIFNNPYTTKADLFSFGTIMWQCYAWRLPFINASQVKEYVQEKNREPIPARCPNNIAPFIQRCWEHDPYNRPTTEELYQALRSTKSGL